MTLDLKQQCGHPERVESLGDIWAAALQRHGQTMVGVHVVHTEEVK
jgi:hypothetical protein